MLVYFDTNIFDNLLKKTQGITERVEASLRAAIKSGALSVLVEIHAIDETAASRRDPVPQLRLIWELCDWDRIVKPADMLLVDDIKHFAFSGDAAHPFIEARQRDGLSEAMQMLLADSERLTKMRELVQKRAFTETTVSFQHTGPQARDSI